jgi:hypothetical protein
MKALWLYSLFLAYLNLRYMHVTMVASNGKDIETKAERSFDLDFVFDIEAKRTCCTASHKPFLDRKRPSQQNGERRKRNEKEDYIHVECKQLQDCLHPLPPIQMR